MILRLDKNKILHMQKQPDLYAGNFNNEMITILLHHSLLNENPTQCEFTLYYNTQAIKNGASPLFLSNEQKDSFYIIETIIDSNMISTSGVLEIWLEIKTPTTTIETKTVKINIKPSRKLNEYKYTTANVDEIKKELITLRNETKAYYNMTKKCVEVIAKFLDENKKEGM